MIADDVWWHLVVHGENNDESEIADEWWCKLMMGHDKLQTSMAMMIVFEFWS